MANQTAEAEAEDSAHTAKLLLQLRRIGARIERLSGLLRITRSSLRFGRVDETLAGGGRASVVRRRWRRRVRGSGRRRAGTSAA